MMIFLIVVLILWIICGIITYGLVLNLWYEDFGLKGNEIYHAIFMAILSSASGPIGMFLAFILSQTEISRKRFFTFLFRPFKRRNLEELIDRFQG